uniref:bifunctional metallophosphatase/5'-nucleotidase n=1 Tax=Thaumasiovibrio occultus TaxID=1891184 RepID=UPI000B35A92A|nr:bifunctional UDP-sugar hydrolase/5'-nucleotidase [Thaumasiovibrio occultus]
MKDTFILNIAHINDSHSNFATSAVNMNLNGLPRSVQCGGLGLVASALAEARAEHADQPFLFLDAGDSFQGSLYFSMYKGALNADMHNALKPDAFLLGNHEFDLGNELALKFVNALDCPVLAGNWDVSSLPSMPENLISFDTERGIGRYLVREFGEHRVAIMGITLDNMADIAHPSPQTPFLDVVTTLRAMVAEAKQQGIDNIIVLSHLGYSRDQQLAQEVGGISAIFGGHSHTWQGDFSQLGLPNAEPYGKRVGDTLIFQAGCNGLLLGQAQLAFAASGRAELRSGAAKLLISTEQVMAADFHQQLRAHPLVWMGKRHQAIKKLLQPYEQKIADIAQENIAEAQRWLRHIRVPNDDLSSEVAPLVCDAFVWQARERGMHVDAAMHNAGGVRVDVAKGNLTAGDIAGRLLPFAIDIVRYQVRGSQLRDALEGAINNALGLVETSSGDGSFPYTSHLRYTFKRSMPEGERIISLELFRNSEWVPVADDELYWMVSSSYTALGKEGYDALLCAVTPPESIGVTMSDAFVGFARKHGVLDAPKVRLAQLID